MTSETALTLLLTTARRIPEAMDAARSGAWAEWSPFWMCGKGVQFSTVGILGLGRIGECVARKLSAFNPAKVIYHNRNVRKDCEFRV